MQKDAHGKVDPIRPGPTPVKVVGDELELQFAQNPLEQYTWNPPQQLVTFTF